VPIVYWVALPQLSFGGGGGAAACKIEVNKINNK
jgi:hypothetical protein